MQAEVCKSGNGKFVNLVHMGDSKKSADNTDEINYGEYRVGFHLEISGMLN